MNSNSMGNQEYYFSDTKLNTLKLKRVTLDSQPSSPGESEALSPMAASGCYNPRYHHHHPMLGSNFPYHPGSTDMINKIQVVLIEKSRNVPPPTTTTTTTTCIRLKDKFQQVIQFCWNNDSFKDH
ncbi:unnamed protein product [Trichobilharzia regenti]|nr:unnamed protein product [Trichobilharzia regenti]